MKKMISNPELIAKCGLYCGGCGAYLKGRCKGCAENVKATWCKVRSCCIENSYKSCADCTKVPLESCDKFNNRISKIIGFLFNSNRAACIRMIREKGAKAFADEMCRIGKHSLPRKSK